MTDNALKYYPLHVADSADKFHGAQMLFFGWDQHLMFCAPFAQALLPTTLFGDLMAAFQVHFTETGEELACNGQESLLRSMERLGRKGIPVGCRNGGCGVCKIQVLDGAFDKRVMSRAQVTAEEETAGIALACRITPTSNLRIRVLGKMRNAFGQPINKQTMTGE